MLYLASKSPRRAELLRQIGVKFAIIDIEIDESARDGEAVTDLVQRLSCDKARYAREWCQGMGEDDLILAADTLIHLHGQIIGKPESEQDCRDILQRLSGQTHEVVTAVALIDYQGELEHRVSRNEISFRSLTGAEIEAYCASTEPHDKAGAYAIQGKAAMFIHHMTGSYSAVMGLPLFETAELLQQAGLRFE